MNKKSMLIKVAALTLGLGLISGCATTEQLQQMQADIVKAQETADAALSAANIASDAAASASDAAVAAQQQADEAAHAASACAERCNRMMEKSMAK